MIFSKKSQFSDAQAITATAISENVIELNEAGTPHNGVTNMGYRIGDGTPIPLLIQITETFDNATSITVAFESGSTTSLGTIEVEQTIALADLVAGKQFNIDKIPTHVDNRYIGLRYTVTGTAPTAGKITAALTLGIQTNVHGA